MFNLALNALIDSATLRLLYCTVLALVKQITIIFYNRKFLILEQNEGIEHEKNNETKILLKFDF